MLRTLVAAIATVCTIGLLGAPNAAAAPKFCDGAAYKTACASGDGGMGPYIRKKIGNTGHHVNVYRDGTRKVD